MKFIEISILFLLFGFTPPKNTINTKDEIIWDNNKLLNWSDFKKKPSIYDISSDAALTASSIQVQTSILNNLLKVSIISKFYPYQSWTIKDRQSNSLLKHEQLHFDISELYARKIRKEILEKVIFRKDYNKIDIIINSYTKEWKKTQVTYDTESDHNRNSAMQEKWEKFIADELAKYTNYSQTELNITLK